MSCVEDKERRTTWRNEKTDQEEEEEEENEEEEETATGERCVCVLLEGDGVRVRDRRSAERGDKRPAVERVGSGGQGETEALLRDSQPESRVSLQRQSAPGVGRKPPDSLPTALCGTAGGHGLHKEERREERAWSQFGFFLRAADGERLAAAFRVG